MSSAFMPRQAVNITDDIKIHRWTIPFERSRDSAYINNIAQNIPPHEWVYPSFVEECRLFQQYQRILRFLSSENFDYFVVSAPTATGKTFVVSY